MKIILLIANYDGSLYWQRREWVEELLKSGYRVCLALPYGEKVELLKEMGCQYEEISFQPHGLNPLGELRLLSRYIRLIKRVRPDMVFTYSIKPNIYGAVASRCNRVPCVATVTGLGPALKGSALLRLVSVCLYQFAFTKIQTVFFQNSENMQFFRNYKIAVNKHKMVNGSGVNLERFHFLAYPAEPIVRFLFIGRMSKVKGILEYMEAASRIRQSREDVEFHICGPLEEEDCEKELRKSEKNGAVLYHGAVNGAQEILRSMHCLILPSYHEGMSNVLLEAAASGRPLLASDVAGCREIVDDGINGYLFSPGDVDSLTAAIERFLDLSTEERKNLGRNSRIKVEGTFDRKKVVSAYMSELALIDSR